MESDIEKITAQGLDVNSLMRCAYILHSYFFMELSAELVERTKVWLLENINRPEVDFVLEQILGKIMERGANIPDFKRELITNRDLIIS